MTEQISERLWWPPLNHGVRSVLTYGLLLATLLAMFAPRYVEHIRAASAPTRFKGDARQDVWLLLRFYDERLFQDDYSADYYQARMPKGCQWLYRVTSTVVDPRIVGKILPYVLLVLTLALVGRASWSLAGPFAAWATAALVLSSNYYLAFTSGGFPRSFGFVLGAAANLSLIADRPYWLAAITAVSAAFYPPTAVLCGATLFVFIMLPPHLGGTTQRWSVRRRVVVLSAGGMLTVAMVTPNVLGLAAYGRTISASRPQDVAQYPEILGRHSPKSRQRLVSWTGIVTEPFHYATRSLANKRNRSNRSTSREPQRTISEASCAASFCFCWYRSATGACGWSGSRRDGCSSWPLVARSPTRSQRFGIHICTTRRGS